MCQAFCRIQAEILKSASLGLRKEAKEVEGCCPFSFEASWETGSFKLLWFPTGSGHWEWTTIKTAPWLYFLILPSTWPKQWVCGGGWFRVSKVPLHHRRDHEAGQNKFTSWDEKTKVALLAFPLLFYSTKGPNPWSETTTFKMSPSLSLPPLLMRLQRHTHKCALPIMSGKDFWKYFKHGWWTLLMWFEDRHRQQKTEWASQQPSFIQKAKLKFHTAWIMKSSSLRHASFLWH